MLRLLNIFILLILKGGLSAGAETDCDKYKKYTEDYPCDSKLIKCYTVGEEIKYDFDKEELTYYNKRFYKDINTYLIFTDFDQDRESDDIDDMISAIYYRYNRGSKRLANMVVCEYGSVIDGKCFKQSEKNLPYIGKCIAKIMNALVEIGLRVIGNGIGAALMKPFGLRYNTSEIIRTIALDPAGSPYGVTDTDLISLEKNNVSHFRDCHHTNGNKYAIKCGISDYYYNLNVTVQPGCKNGTESEQEMCSHKRMIKYFNESIRNGTAFYGVQCDYVKPNYDKDCPNIHAWFPAGFNARIIEHGPYQVKTRAYSPYGYGFYANSTRDEESSR